MLLYDVTRVVCGSNKGFVNSRKITGNAVLESIFFVKTESKVYECNLVKVKQN